MGDSLRYKDWYEKAAHDLRGAQILMEYDGGNDLVAFHCQQEMEKMLKGWLLKKTDELFVPKNVSKVSFETDFIC